MESFEAFFASEVVECAAEWLEYIRVPGDEYQTRVEYDGHGKFCVWQPDAPEDVERLYRVTVVVEQLPNS